MSEKKFFIKHKPKFSIGSDSISWINRAEIERREKNRLVNIFSNENFLTKKIPKFSIGYDFISWINRQEIEHSEKNKIFNVLQFDGNWLNPDYFFDPFDLLNIYKYKEIIKYLEEYLEWLQSTPYTFNLLNKTTEIFSDVVWAYQLRNGMVNIQARYDVKPDENTVMEYFPCLDMYSYAIAIYVDDQEVLRTKTWTVGEINTQEQIDHGQMLMCEDAWTIFLG